jgi:hypothetical protein
VDHFFQRSTHQAAASGSASLCEYIDFHILSSESDANERESRDTDHLCK